VGVYRAGVAVGLVSGIQIYISSSEFLVPYIVLSDILFLCYCIGAH